MPSLIAATRNSPVSPKKTVLHAVRLYTIMGRMKLARMAAQWYLLELRSVSKPLGFVIAFPMLSPAHEVIAQKDPVQAGLQEGLESIFRSADDGLSFKIERSIEHDGHSCQLLESGYQSVKLRA